MRSFDESHRRLNVLNNLPVWCLHIVKFLLDTRFFFRELRILPIINLFRECIVDKFLHKRILPTLIFFEIGTKCLFLFGNVCSHGSIFFFGGIHHEIENLVVKPDPFQLFSNKLDELFFAQVWLRTAVCPEGFGASVVHMTLLFFRGYFESALAAYHKPAIGVLPRFRSPDKLRRGKYVLHLVEKFLRNNWLVRSGMGLSVPLKHPAVDWILENVVKGGLVDDLSSASSKPFLLQFCGDRNDRVAFCGVESECFSDIPRFFFKDYQSFCFWIACIPKGRGAWIFSSSHFLRQSPLHISTQVSDVLIRHGKLDACDDDVIIGIVIAFKRFDLLNRIVLKHPFDQSFVHRIPRQAVNFPTQYSIRSAFFDKLEHFRKHRTSRRFC